MIAHLDMDAFYASVELRRRPELRGKAVIVCGSGPRAVVTTASYEARKFGVHSAMPASQARRLCPDAICLAPDFAAYRDASRQVMDIVRQHAYGVEVIGLDEVYLDLTEALTPRTAMRRLVTEIRAQTRLDCSVGLAENKLLAKLASELAKPAGMVRLTRSEALRRFAGASPGVIPGIGPKTVARLESMNIRSLEQLRATAVERLQAGYGARQGVWLHRRAHFEDDSPVTEERRSRSQSAETTFDSDISGLDRMEASIETLATELCRRIGTKQLAGRNIAIKVRLDDWTTVTRARTLESPTGDPKIVAAVARDLLRAYAPARPVRLLGVRIAGFDDPPRRPIAGERAPPSQLRLTL